MDEEEEEDACLPSFLFRGMASSLFTLTRAAISSRVALGMDYEQGRVQPVLGGIIRRTARLLLPSPVPLLQQQNWLAATVRD